MCIRDSGTAASKDSTSNVAKQAAIKANGAKIQLVELRQAKEVDLVCASIKGMATAKYYPLNNECQSESPMTLDECKGIQGRVVARPASLNGEPETVNMCEGSMYSKYLAPSVRDILAKKLEAGTPMPVRIKYARKIAP